MGISYEPSGTSGYRCELVGANGLSVVVALSTEGSQVNATPTDLPARALVGAIEQFGEHEFGRRRTRNEQKRRYHEKQVSKWRDAAEHISALLGDLTDKVEQGWCSGCLTDSTHWLVDAKTRFGTRQYVCGTCGTPTGWCDVPRCDNFANRCDMPRKAQRFCAEHSHDIPSFEKLDDQISTLDEYVSWLDFERVNASGVTKIAVASLAGVAVLAPAAFFAAPAIGGAIGAYTGLSGAAATSHGLAILGGGSLAAGGFGMAGGTMVVAAGGAGLGGAMGASVATAYVGADKSFDFEKVADGDGVTVVFANGFLSEGQVGWGSWERMVRQRYPDASVYRLAWGSKELKSLTGLVARQLPARAGRMAIEQLIAEALKQGPKMLGPLSALLMGADIAKNPWHVAKTRATMTGSVLADALVRSDLRSVILVGFSLGARVMVAAAESLATREGGPRVESIHLLGAAVGTGRDWHAIERAAEANVWNYWSDNDRVLRYLYRVGDTGAKAIGCEGIPVTSPKIKNVNVSSIVRSHKSHLEAVKLR